MVVIAKRRDVDSIERREVENIERKEVDRIERVCLKTKTQQPFINKRSSSPEAEASYLFPAKLGGVP